MDETTMVWCMHGLYSVQLTKHSCEKQLDQDERDIESQWTCGGVSVHPDPVDAHTMSEHQA